MGKCSRIWFSTVTSTVYPVLSVDEKTLYFASDMLWNKGFSDLFSVTINKGGT
jgi:hypothetical protein